MSLEWAILLGGIGTYLMRSTGVWLSPAWFQARWLNHLPFAVILVMAVSSVSNLTGPPDASLGAVSATLAVAIASLKKVPLVVCIAVGCLVYGAIVGP